MAASYPADAASGERLLMGAYRFRPPLWAWLGLLPMLALLVTLGSWQLHKGRWKQQLQQRMDLAPQQAVLQLDAAAPAPEALQPRQARAAGRYDSERQLLLDNQSHERRPGYRVWTPLQLADGSLLIVDRGWLAQAWERSQLPLLTVDRHPREVAGLWRPLPEPGLRIAADNCASGAWPRVVQYPTPADLRCLYGDAVLPGLLLLDPGQPDGYVRDWRVGGGLPPTRHYAYAAQWYAFALTLLALFIRLNLQRRPS